jgi:structure-specific endonuclease subunit SLX1
LEVDYVKEKKFVKKAKEIIDFEREGACSVCHTDLEHDTGIYTICPNPGCEAVTHMTCLSKHFLKSEPDSLLPINGTCPSCKTDLQWLNVVKELSLRMRGHKEVEKLLKAKRSRKGKTTSESIEDDIEEDEDDDLESDIAEEIKRLREFNPTGARMDMGDSWHAIDDSDETDAGSVVNTASPSKTSNKQGKKVASRTSKAINLDPVIEDSDWDDALVLD